LGALPFEQRSAFVLAHLQGLSYEEVARIEGVGVGTVKSRIAKGAKAMQSRSIQGFVPLPLGAMHVKTPKTRKSDWLVVRSDWMPASR
jgi:predicted RNA polymerase sigma factor